MIDEYDIFLDTPLSGVVAASYFAAGMPTLTFKNSNSWVEFYKEKFSLLEVSFEEHEYIFNNSEDYIKIAGLLIVNFEYRKARSMLQSFLGEHFFNTADMYTQHVKIVEGIINDNSL